MFAKGINRFHSSKADSKYSKDFLLQEAHLGGVFQIHQTALDVAQLKGHQQNARTFISC